MNDVNSSNPNWGDKTILIVEDDKFNAIIITNFIEKTHANYKIAYSGQNAIDLANDLNPDVILMDIKLPDINGLEVTRKIKEKLPNAIVIAQTAYVSDSDKQNAFDAGCSDVIFKPIRYDNLIATISKYVK